MKPELSQELVIELLSYSREDGLFYWKKRGRNHFSCNRSWNRWNNRYTGTLAGAPSSDGYRRISINNVRYKSHRLAFLYVHGYMPKYIDHIDQDGKNNSIDNLRDVTHQKNHMNQRRSKSNTSGTTGVTWRKDTNKWQAQVMVDGKNISLGSFGDKKDAIKARKAAEKKYGFHKNHGL